ncbi:MAG: aspartate carbamoyltransferase regulatory subunit, partial [Clostridiales bacterium]|nr:aspartate carbamoyltransferase regulatory subunit [Clostridiales bacterium]
MNVDGIKKGIVLDHIKAGRGMDIYRLLHLEKMKCSVAIVQNARSTKYGRKDIIKIDEMITLDMDMLGYIDPNITINIVENGKLHEKKNLELPEKLTNVIR